MPHRRSIVLATTAGLACALVLAAVNLGIGQRNCLSTLECRPPLPGESGCGPSPLHCDGPLLRTEWIALAALGVAVTVWAVAALRRLRCRS